MCRVVPVLSVMCQVVSV